METYAICISLSPHNSVVSSPIWTIDGSNDSRFVAFQNTLDRPRATPSQPISKHQRNCKALLSLDVGGDPPASRRPPPCGRGARHMRRSRPCLRIEGASCALSLSLFARHGERGGQSGLSYSGALSLSFERESDRAQARERNAAHILDL